MLYYYSFAAFVYLKGQGINKDLVVSLLADCWHYKSLLGRGLLRCKTQADKCRSAERRA